VRARHYDPETGRFLQPDPLGIAADQLYAYAANDPYRLWDPTGRDPGMRRASILPIWRWDPVAELSIADSATYQRSEAQSQAEFSLATLDLFAGAAELATHYPESHGTATYQRTLPVARAARALGVFGVGFSGALLMQSMESGDEYAIAANSIGLGLNAATVAYPILLPADALFFAVDSSVGVDRMLRLEADLQLQRSRAITTGPTPIDVIVGLFE
jgi:hypothetical protein